jgi:GAF domain-containing protein
MARLSVTGGRASKAKVRRASQAKGRKIAKASPNDKQRRNAVQDTEVARLKRELKEALERQTATAEVLQVISDSISNATPVFERILESTGRLITCENAGIFLAMPDGQLHLAAIRGPHAAAIQGIYPRPLAQTAAPIVMAARRQICFEDAANGPDVPALLRQIALATTKGNFSIALTPLMWEGNAIGVLNVSRDPGVKFSDRELSLLRTFADQAVIAIQNARLFNEVEAKTRDLTESLQQQTATADVLKVISRSAFDLDAVMHTLARSAGELCVADMCGLYIREGDFLVCRGYTAISKEQEEFVRQARIPADDTNFYMNRALSSGEIANIGDFENDRSVGTRAFQEKLGFRSLLVVPLMREGHGMGLFVLGRDRVGEFSLRHIELVQTFADQAVIAIENARLFNEVQARTEDLRESLTYQTAISDVLNIISRSPSDIQPVLDTIAATAQHLCQSEHAYIFRLEHDKYHLVAARDVRPERTKFLRDNPIIPNRGSTVGRVAAEGRSIHIMDALADNEYKLSMVGHGGRTILGVPLLRDGIVIGVIVLTRAVVHPFSERQIELVSIFADQALIAIENVRLFDEVQAKTRDLTEALTYQTGSGNILKVIASSPTDVGPVLKAIVESACELCDAVDAIVLLNDGDSLRASAHHGPIPLDMERWPIRRNWTAGRAFLDQKPVHVQDLLSAEGDEFPDTRQRTARTGTRSILSVPLLREGKSIGAIVLRRTDVHPFSDKQIALLQTYADQAVIAIGNVRLFVEVQERTEDLRESLRQQSATADVLKVISRSTFDLQTVLQTLVESAARLCDADKATITREKDGQFYHAEIFGYSDEFLDYVRDVPVLPERGSCLGRVLFEGAAVHIPDVLLDPEYTFSEGQRLGGFRTMLGVPMLREGIPIGVVALTRSEPRPFTDKQIELVTTFADQAAIAIENVRLFGEVQAKTRDLSEALTYQTGSANILSVIASSPTDVEPVLKAIVQSACELCDAYDAFVRLRNGDNLEFGAHYGPIPITQDSVPISRGWTAGLAVIERRPVHVHDLLSSEGDEFPEARELGRAENHRTILSIPLMREAEGIGAIVLRRTEVHPFSGKQIALLQTFADQAVIAIGNVHLFKQVQQRTRELSNSLDDLRTAQDRLVQTEKLASLGQLTAGIAHEIKNPLNFVNNFSALSAELVDELNDTLKPAALEHRMRQEVDDLTQMLKGNLEKVVQHGKRADSIVKNMLLHSREGAGERRSVEINAIIDESLNLAYHGARAEKSGFDITLQKDLDPDAGMADVYPQEITRALLNLISNGFYAATRRAAETGDGFEPTLNATTKDLGDKIEIRIRDNGMGIAPEVKEKIFNPFFTTKPAGEGTGLGLSMSHDIVVKQHGGTIDVDTEPGIFTEFIIRLPRT